MSSPEPPKIAYEDAHCMVATWRWLIMPVMGRPTLPARSAQRQVIALQEHGRRIGHGKVVEMTLIDPEAPLPGAETRAVFDAGVAVVSPYYGCVSAVFEADGFRGAFVRGMLTSFQILSRNKYPQKVFSSIDDAARWTFELAPAIGIAAASAAEVGEAAHAVRRMAIEKGIFGPPATPNVT